MIVGFVPVLLEEPVQEEVRSSADLFSTTVLLAAGQSTDNHHGRPDAARDVPESSWVGLWSVAVAHKLHEIVHIHVPVLRQVLDILYERSHPATVMPLGAQEPVSQFLDSGVVIHSLDQEVP